MGRYRGSMRWLAAMCLGCFICGCLGIEGTDVSTGQDVQSTGDGDTSGPVTTTSPPPSTGTTGAAEDEESDDGGTTGWATDGPDPSGSSASTGAGETGTEDTGTDTGTETGTETGTSSDGSTDSTGGADDDDG
jgi:hypothetical protein